MEELIYIIKNKRNLIIKDLITKARETEKSDYRIENNALWIKYGGYILDCIVENSCDNCYKEKGMNFSSLSIAFEELRKSKLLENMSSFLLDIKCVKRSIFDIIKKYLKKSKQYFIIMDFVEGFFDDLEIEAVNQWSYCFEGETKFKKITEITTAFVYMHEGEKFTYVNDAIIKFTGYSKEELYEIKWWEIIEKKYSDLLKNKVKHRLESMKVGASECDVRILTKSGELKWVHINCDTLIIKNKPSIIGLGFDIDENRKTEEVVKESEKKLRELINSIPDYISFKDGESRIIDINKCAMEFYGIKDQDVSGKKYEEINEIINCRKTYKTRNVSDELVWRYGKNYRYEQETIYEDGNERIFDIIKVPIIENGNRKGIITIGRDITEIKNAKHRLLESEERYKQLLANLPDPVIVHANDKIMYVNDAAVRLVQEKNFEDIVGKNLSDLMYSFNEDINDVVNRLKIIKKTRYYPPYEEKFILRKNSNIIDLEIATSLVEFEGVNAALLVSRDITSKKTLQDLSEKIEEKSRQLEKNMEYDKVKTEFFSNISHELKTPVNVIFGTVQLFELMINKDEVNCYREKLNEYLKIMKQNCYRLVRIVNNIIDITKIDSGYFHLELKNGNIVQTIEEITQSVVCYVQNKGIDLIFDTEEEEIITAFDQDKIDRIILNLLSNAVKFTPNGGNILVNIHKNQNLVKISVKDSGIGVPYDMQSKIFERFIQVDKSLSRNREGSGIGLSLVKSLVEMHDGKIRLVSKPDSGSEFIIELPIKIIDKNLDVAENEVACDTKNEIINLEFSDI